MLTNAYHAVRFDASVINNLVIKILLNDFPTILLTSVQSLTTEPLFCPEIVETACPY